MGRFGISFSLWYIRHKRLIDFVAILFLVLANAALGFYIFRLSRDYYFSPKPRDPEILVKLPAYEKEVQDLEVLESKALASGGLYDLVAQIKNPNQDFGLQELNYKFILYDAAGEVLKELAGTKYILPGETKYLIRTNISTLGKKVAKTELELTPQTWLKKRKMTLPDIVVLNEWTKWGLNEVGQLELFTIIWNNSYHSFRTVEVNVVCLDRSNSILGVNYTTLNNLYAQSQREIRLRWPDDFRSQISQTIIEMETNLFDAKNFVEFEEEGPADTAPEHEYRDI